MIELTGKLQDLTKEYRRLDLNDLEYLEYRANKMNDKQRLDAITFAKDSKSEDTEKTIKQWENRYAGIPQTEESVAKYGDIDDN